MRYPTRFHLACLALLLPTGCTGDPDDFGEEAAALETPVEIGSLPSELEVTPTGSASIRIPIDVPEGRLGLGPKLAMVYDSRGGNGIVGVGWSLAGLSSIQRCAPTQAYDGRTGGVGFNFLDRFCLDGRPLVVINGAIYGAAGTEYRTVPDDQTRVILDSTYANGTPISFTVYHRDGRIGSYRDRLEEALVSSTALDGTLSIAPSQSVYAWDLTTVQDRNGNYMTVQWGTDRTYGRAVGHYPIAIRYTYGPTYGSGTPPRMVKFLYEGRPDSIERYVSGFHHRMVRRLSAIETHATEGGVLSLLHTYRLGYRSDTVTRRSVLQSIEKCDAIGACLPATVITTEAGNLNQGAPIQVAAVTGIPKFHAADFDGDGQDDVLWWTEESGWQLRFGRPGGFTAPTMIDPLGTVLALIDADLDGRTEILVRGGELLRWGGTSFQTLQPDMGGDYWNDLWDRPAPPKFADLDGNGTPDFVHREQDELSGSPAVWSWRKNGGSYQVPYLATELGVLEPGDAYSEGAAVRLLGNGATQVLYDGGSSYRALFISGSRLDSAPTNLPVGFFWDMFLDVNGDGLDDHLDLYDGRLRINTGRGFGPSYVATTSGWMTPGPTLPQASAFFEGYVADKGVRAVDLNNDGRMDFVQYSRGVAVACLSNGVNFACQPYEPLVDLRTRTEVDGPVSYPFAMIDHDGDGVKDLLRVSLTGYLEVVPRTGAIPDRVVAIRDGLGSDDIIEYSTTTDPIVYTPGPTVEYCHYPQRCNPRRMPVVKGIFRDSGTIPADRVELYHYADGRSDLRGAGFVGFGRFRREEVAHGRITEQTCSVLPTVDGRYAYRGMPEWTTVFQRIASTQARVITTDWSNIGYSTGGGTHFARPSGAITREYEWSISSGIPVPAPSQPLETVVATRTPYRTVTRVWSYDTYANLLRSAESRPGGTAYERTMTHENRTSTWLIGLLTSETIKSTGKNSQVDQQLVRHYNDSRGRRSTTIVEPDRSALSRYISYGYGEDGLPSYVTEWGPTDSARATTRGWDAERIHPAWVQNAVGHRTSVQIHPGLGMMLRSQDPNGVVTRFDYDTFGRLRRRTGADGRITEVQLAPGATSGVAFRTTQLANTGETSVTDHDRLGRPVQTARIVGASQSLVLQTYDLPGRVATLSLPHMAGATPEWVRFTRDLMGRPLVVNRPDGTATYFRYSPFRTERWDPPGHYQYRDVDADGALARTMTWVDGRPLVTTYRQGPFERLIEVIDPAGNRTDVMEYDSLGRRTRMVNADAGEQLMTYNAFGELTSARNGAGQLVDIDRDSLGRPTTRSAPDGVTTYSWDAGALGRLGSATSPDGVTTTFGYDGLGRMVSQTVGGSSWSMQMLRAYDSLGRLSAVSYPATPAGGLTVSYVYGSDGRLARAESGSTIWWRAQMRDAWAHVTQERLGNGTLVDFGYDARSGRLLSVVGRKMAWTGDPSAPYQWQRFQDLAVTYHPNGPVATRQDSIEARSESFTYDGADRLVGWIGDNGVLQQGYDYDDLGNMISASGPAGTDVYEHLGPGPHAVTSIDGNPIDYDGAGRRVQGPGLSVSYTSFDLPRHIASSNGTTKFEYDAFEARTVKRGAAGETRYLGGFYQRRAAPQQPPTHHFSIYAGGRLVAELVEDERTATRTPRYIHPDHLGSASVITGAAGETLERRRYAPFGDLIGTDPAGLSSFTGGFTGHEGDWAEGLINMRGRIYDPATRRFLTPDPLVTNPTFGQNFNRYSYVVNSPLTLVDPSGFEYEWEYIDQNAEYDEECYQCDYDDGYNGGGTSIVGHRTDDNWTDPGPSFTYYEYGDRGSGQSSPGYDASYTDSVFDVPSYDDYEGYDVHDDQGADRAQQYLDNLPRANEWERSYSRTDLHESGELPLYANLQMGPFGGRGPMGWLYPTPNRVMSRDFGGYAYQVYDDAFSIAFGFEATLVLGVGVRVAAGINLSPGGGAQGFVTAEGRVGFDLGVSVGPSMSSNDNGIEQGWAADARAAVGWEGLEVGASINDSGEVNGNASVTLGLESPVSFTAGGGYTAVW